MCCCSDCGPSFFNFSIVSDDENAFVVVLETYGMLARAQPAHAQHEAQRLSDGTRLASDALQRSRQEHALRTPGLGSVNHPDLGRREP